MVENKTKKTNSKTKSTKLVKPRALHKINPDKKNIIIEINNLNKQFKKVVAIKNLSLKIFRGDRVALVGANGAGKTTLIETIIGLYKPTKGKIELNLEYEQSPLEKIGVQFQEADYPDGLLTKDIIDFFSEINPYYSMQKSEIDELIDQFQMRDFAYRPARSLSGGQRQKLNVFLAFVSKPELVFLDELSTGLDIKVRNVITNFVFNYLKEKQTTLIVVSHNSIEIEQLCERIIVMKQGEIMFDNSVNEAKKQYQSIENLMNAYI